MTYSSRREELDRLCEILVAQPEGLGIDALLQAVGPATSRRTLQRRLATLVEQGRLEMRGQARAIHYCIPRLYNPAFPPRMSQVSEPAVAPSDIPLSREAEEIRAYVRRPRHLRKPVGYQLAFLEQYHPNQTYYLSASLREQLRNLGRSPAEQTPAGTFARDILNRLLIDLSWASSRLEGNTYSRLDTERLIEFGQAAEGKDALETQMILNHKQAIEYLVRDPRHSELSTDTVIALHALLSDCLMVDPSACGQLRKRVVEIGGSVYLPISLPQRLQELFGIVVEMAGEIEDPFEQSFFLMVHLPYLQPFEDVNKRVSRLAANIPFIRHNLCPLSFIDLPQQVYVDAMMGVYELNRVELLRDVFAWAYARSCQQYVAVKRDLVPPDIFRLRYRRAVGEVVAAIVRGGRSATPAVIRRRIPPDVATADKRHFVDVVLAEFKFLHAGNVVRFGLRPLEFAAWMEKHSDHGTKGRK